MVHKDDKIYVEQAKRFIEDNVQVIRSAKQIADAVGMPYESLRRMFRLQVGKPIWKYVEEQRIGNAKYFLRATDWKCYRIAQEIGLHDEKWFIKLFKQLVGVTPAEYRQQFHDDQRALERGEW
jgi:two-component system response regulator YesN